MYTELVTVSVDSVIYEDGGIYRWYFFGQGTFGQVNLVIAGESLLLDYSNSSAMHSCK